MLNVYPSDACDAFAGNLLSCSAVNALSRKAALLGFVYIFIQVSIAHASNAKMK
jgi:hypothetical protein